jgi:aminoglycoside/choline kinase family phosphotransferase
MAVLRAGPLSSEREAIKAAFLANAGLGDARRQPLAGDASTRAYERLYPATGPSLIFMDQPPSQETAPCPPDATPEQRATLGYNALARLAAGRVEAFIDVACYLTSLGLSAPKVITADAPQGLAVFEDLGDGLFARLIEQGQDDAPLYDAAIDVLVQLHRITPPDVLPGGWPLLAYDDVALKTGQDLFPQWFPNYRPGLVFDDQVLADWNAFWTPVRARGEAGASVFCLRDYHAENLIWLPERRGTARVGLLDLQDALRAHPVWDLSMLLHDARRDISPALEAACLGRYLNAAQIKAPAAFLADYQAIGALNIVRIIGVFSRLVVRDGKTRYATFMPRMWGYLDRCLKAPGMGELKAWFDANVPVEARS